MPKTIEVRNDVFVTGSVACDFKELREFYRANVDKFIIAFDEIKKILKVNDDVKLLFNNIRKNSVQGMFTHNTKTIKIDLRCYDVTQIVSTIIHEMTHAQQVQDKKLVIDAKSQKWNGKSIELAKSHEDYLNLPWEIEARKNEEKYINRVLTKIQKVEAK